MDKTYDIVFIGLSLSSAWGNGHATTFRSLLRGLDSEGKSILFLERDVPWYRDSRDMPNPDFCDLAYYSTPNELRTVFNEEIERAAAVIIGSYVPDGVDVIDIVTDTRAEGVWFYDIDTPVTLAKLAVDDEEYIAPRQIHTLEGYFSFSGGPALATLRQRYGARAVHPLYCAVDEELYHPTNDPTRWDLGYLGTYSLDRQPTIEQLLIEPARRLPRMRFVVAGPQYPDTIDWPENVERLDHIAPHDHAAFYNGQRFTLNVTRADMKENGWSPSVRLFEAAACGVPIISDRWNGVEDIFTNGRAIALADTADDVVSLLLERDEDWREALGQTARRRVLDRHTGRRRAQELLGHLGLNKMFAPQSSAAKHQHLFQVE